MPAMSSIDGTSPEAASERRPRGRERQRTIAFVFALLPGALVVFFGFTAGGYYPGATAMATAALAVLLGLRFLLLPATRFTPALIAACAAMAAFVVWTYASQDWSDSVARASLAADRALLYFLALLLFGSLPGDDRRLRWMIRSVVVGIVVVCAVGLGSRLLPDLLATPLAGFDTRLGYPLTYWNALGFLAAIGVIFCVHITKSGAETRTWNALAAAAVPMLIVVLYLTLSRGGILAGAIGLVVYLLLARNPGTIPALISTVPTSLVAALSAYQADILVTADFATAEGASAGGRVLAVLIACMAASALVRVGLAIYAAQLTIETPLTRLGNRARVALGLGAVLLVAAAGLIVFGGEIQQAYDDFFEGSAAPISTGKERLGEAGGSGRRALWDVGMASFDRDPVKGSGAGTFALEWLRAESAIPAQNAHSLYVETLSDLGLIGMVLLGSTLLIILVFGFALRIRGKGRTIYAALLGAGVAWAIHNAVDWDWEMPATTIWLFALGGAALAWTSPDPHTSDPFGGAYTPRLELKRRELLRVLAALACLCVAVFPLSIAISQSRLDHAIAAFEAGECGKARSYATDALSTAPWRPEGSAILGYCTAAMGDTGQGVEEMQRALEADPRNPEYLYAYAQSLAADGRDATDVIDRAVAADPRNPYLATHAEAFRDAEGNPDALRRAAAASPPLDLTRGANTLAELFPVEAAPSPTPVPDPSAAPPPAVPGAPAAPAPAVP